MLRRCNAVWEHASPQPPFRVIDTDNPCVKDVENIRIPPQSTVENRPMHRGSVHFDHYSDGDDLTGEIPAKGREQRDVLMKRIENCGCILEGPIFMNPVHKHGEDVYHIHFSCASNNDGGPNAGHCFLEEVLKP